jgi:NitT/TauT family transport system permease protein
MTADASLRLMKTETAAGDRLSSAVPAAPRPKRASPNLQRIVSGVVGSAAVFLALELLTRVSKLSEDYLPHATSVAVRLLKLLAEPDFLVDALSTLCVWAAGLAAATVVGVAVGTCMGLSKTAYRIGSPVVSLMRPIPSVCIIPLAILVMGQGFAMKFTLAGYATIWPILINTIYGIRSVDPVGVDTARCFGLSRSAVLRRVVLPAAAPMIFTGIRISASIGLVVVVSTELLAATQSGLGSFIFRVSSSGGSMDAMLAGAAFAGIIGVAINTTLRALDDRWFGWRRRKEET